MLNFGSIQLGELKIRVVASKNVIAGKSQGAVCDSLVSVFIERGFFRDFKEGWLPTDLAHDELAIVFIDRKIEAVITQLEYTFGGLVNAGFGVFFFGGVDLG